jgi:hypothetical protein
MRPVLPPIAVRETFRSPVLGSVTQPLVATSYAAAKLERTIRDLFMEIFLITGTRWCLFTPPATSPPPQVTAALAMFLCLCSLLRNEAGKPSHLC